MNEEENNLPEWVIAIKEIQKSVKKSMTPKSKDTTLTKYNN